MNPSDPPGQAAGRGVAAFPGNENLKRLARDLQASMAYVSPVAEGILGYRAAEILGRPVADYYRGGLAEARAVLRRLVAEGRIENYETTFRTRDGKWVEVSPSMSLLRDSNETMIGTLGVIKATRRPQAGP